MLEEQISFCILTALFIILSLAKKLRGTRIYTNKICATEAGSSGIHDTSDSGFNKLTKKARNLTRSGKYEVNPKRAKVNDIEDISKRASIDDIEENPKKEGEDNEKRKRRLANEKASLIKFMINSYISFNSVVIFVGMVTETYLYGGRLLFNSVAISIAYVGSFFIFEPFFYNLDKEIKSPYEYLEKRYGNGKIIRAVSAAAGNLFSFFFMTLHLWSCATILSTILPQLSLLESCLILGAYCVFGSTIGGFTQWLNISVLQFLILLAGVISIIIISFTHNSSKTSAELWDLAHEFGRRNFVTIEFNLSTRYTILNQLISLPIPWFTMHTINQRSFTKFRSIESGTRSRLIFISHLPLMFTINLLFTISGIACFIYFYGCDPISEGMFKNKNQLPSYWIIIAFNDFLPSFAGIFLAAIMAYALPQYSLGIHLCAKSIINDIIKPLAGTKYIIQGKVKRTIKFVICAVLGILSIGFSLSYQFVRNSILSLFLVFNDAINAPIFGLFVLSMFNPYANEVGATLAFLCNLAITFWLSLGAVVFSKLRNQEFKPNKFLCNANETDYFNSNFNNSLSYVYDDDFSTTTIASSLNATLEEELYPKNPILFNLYSITPIWYCLFSLIFVVVFGSIFSLIYSLIRTKSFDVDSSRNEERKKFIFGSLEKYRLYNKEASFTSNS